MLPVAGSRAAQIMVAVAKNLALAKNSVAVLAVKSLVAAPAATDTENLPGAVLPAEAPAAIDMENLAAPALENAMEAEARAATDMVAEVQVVTDVPNRPAAKIETLKTAAPLSTASVEVKAAVANTVIVDQMVAEVAAEADTVQEDRKVAAAAAAMAAVDQTLAARVPRVNTAPIPAVVTTSRISMDNRARRNQAGVVAVPQVAVTAVPAVDTVAVVVAQVPAVQAIANLVAAVKEDPAPTEENLVVTGVLNKAMMPLRAVMKAVSASRGGSAETERAVTAMAADLAAVITKSDAAKPSEAAAAVYAVMTVNAEVPSSISRITTVKNSLSLLSRLNRLALSKIYPKSFMMFSPIPSKSNPFQIW